MSILAIENLVDAEVAKYGSAPIGDFTAWVDPVGNRMIQIHNVMHFEWALDYFEKQGVDVEDWELADGGIELENRGWVRVTLARGLLSMSTARRLSRQRLVDLTWDVAQLSKLQIQDVEHEWQTPFAGHERIRNPLGGRGV